MKKSLYLFILLFSFQFAVSQNVKQSDHLPQTQKQIIDRYDKIEKANAEASNTEVIKQLIEQSEKLSFPTGVVRGLITLQRNALMQNDYELSGKYGDEAEPLAYQMKNYDALSNIYLCRGQTDMILDKYPEAEVHLKKAVEYADEIKNKTERQISLCGIYNNFAGMYEGLGDSEKVLKSLQKAMSSIEATPVNSLTEYQKAQYYDLYITGLMNMGSFYTNGLEHPDFELAESYYKRALTFQTSAPEYFKPNEVDMYESLGRFYLKKRDYQKAIHYSHLFLEKEKTDKRPRDRLQTYKILEEANAAIKNITEENKYLKLYTHLNDSINYSEKKAIVQLSRNQIKNSVKENEQSKKIILLSSVFIIAIAIILMVLYRRKSNKLLHSKYEEIISKINSRKENSSIEFLEIIRNNETKSSINIPDDTLKSLLEKLEKFEASEKYLKKEASLTWLANNFNTNTKYLSEIIKIERGKNFSNYINGLRINFIVTKLYNAPKYREYKISHLVEESGFVTHKVFVAAFKNEHGVTPSYFIEKLRASE